MSVRFKDQFQENITQTGGNFVNQATSGFTGGNGGFGRAAGGLGGMSGLAGMGGLTGGAGNLGGMSGLAGAAGGLAGTARGMQNQKPEGLLREAGDFLTRGGGAQGYLQSYIAALEKNPLRTRMLTSGSLAGLQELLAGWIAQDRSRDGNYLNSRIPKMAIYGAFVSAPMGHFMVKILQWLFKDRPGLGSKIALIAISNLIVSPIQNSIYLVSMALISGARTFHQVRSTLRAGFWPVMQVSWISSPIALAFAQAFLPQEMWVPFFNLVAFVIGTYINTITKKRRISALRRKYADDRREYRGGEGERTSGREASSSGYGGISGAVGGMFGSGGVAGGSASEFYDQRTTERVERTERRD